jgi:hypothetical protein
VSPVQKTALPETALLRRYATGVNYTDCFFIDVARPASLTGYVEAFYTTWLFRMERAVLILAGRPSTNAQARALAEGRSSSLAAWQVEAREVDQILLRDLTGRTRSWLMVTLPPYGRTGARLWFGSAIVARPARPGRTAALGRVARALVGLHVVYSRTLLRAAATRVARLSGTTGMTGADP